jgi:hypothetical protein
VTAIATTKSVHRELDSQDQSRLNSSAIKSDAEAFFLDDSAFNMAWVSLLGLQRVRHQCPRCATSFFEEQASPLQLRAHSIVMSPYGPTVVTT